MQPVESGDPSLILMENELHSQDRTQHLAGASRRSWFLSGWCGQALMGLGLYITTVVEERVEGVR